MCLNDFGMKIVFYDLWFHTLKKLCLHNVDILEKLLKNPALNKKYIAEKDDLKFEDDLLWPFLRSYLIQWKICVFIMLSFIETFI